MGGENVSRNKLSANCKYCYFLSRCKPQENTNYCYPGVQSLGLIPEQKKLIVSSALKAVSLKHKIACHNSSV